MASRPAWEGHLKLSLVTCPVTLYPATSRGKAVRFNMINPDTGNRIRTKVEDPETGGEIARTETIKGYEVDKGLYVTLTDDEIRSAKLPDTGSMHIERFVSVKEIDRLYWASPYYLVPNGDVAAEPFSVIREAMRSEGKVALARYVKNGKERLLALEPRGRGIVAHELRPHDQVQAEADYFGRIPELKVDKGMVALAKQILQQHDGPFDPTTFRDRYTEGLLALIEEKRRSQGVSRSRSGPVREAEVINLMDALKRSLAGISAPPAPSKPRAGAIRTAAAKAKAEPKVTKEGKATPLPGTGSRAKKASRA